MVRDATEGTANRLPIPEQAFGGTLNPDKLGTARPI
jgi:hypothetical protein